MGTLQEGLYKTGMITERTIRESEAEQLLRAEMREARLAKPAKERERRLGILKGTSSPDTFRAEARKLLLEQPELSLLYEVLTLAHARGMHEKRNKGGGRLIANLYATREALKNVLSGVDPRAAVDKALPKK